MSLPLTEEQFWARCKRAPNGCLEWQGARNSSGYGTLSWHGKSCVTHRLAAYLAGLVASIASPANKRGSGFVLHKCDNPPCCDPDHLEIGDFCKNQADSYARGRRAQPRGSEHANAKLTDQQAKEIRQRYSQGELQIPLAREFGVSQRVISMIVRRTSYI